MSHFCTSRIIAILHPTNDNLSILTLFSQWHKYLYILYLFILFCSSTFTQFPTQFYKYNTLRAPNMPRYIASWLSITEPNDWINVSNQLLIILPNHPKSPFQTIQAIRIIKFLGCLFDTTTASRRSVWTVIEFDLYSRKTAFGNHFRWN